MNQKRLAQIEKRIGRIKTELSGIGAMRPGSLTLQYKDREQHKGAYYQLSYTHQMKSRTDYIRRDCVNEVKQQVSNFRRFKDLTAEWVALSIEHAKLSMKTKQK